MHFRLEAVETALRLGLFVHLFWLPLPFGSVTEFAQLPLVLTSLYLFALTSLQMLASKTRLSLSPTYLVWTASGLILLAAVALQVVPLPRAVTRTLSPAAHAVWTGAERVHDQLGPAEEFPENFPVSVAPPRTKLHLLRVAAYFALFQTAFLLIRRHEHRMQLALALSAAALFEVFYGLQQLYRGELMIWGWENTKIFNRITGTYVNPNHYGHYLAIIFPIAAYIGLTALGQNRITRKRELISRFLERGLLPVCASILATIGCLTGVLLAQSRGALGTLLAGVLAVVLLATTGRLLRTRSRRRAAQLVPAVAVVLVLAVAVIVLIRQLGVQQTIARFEPLPEERRTLVGRVEGMRAAAQIWRAFPLFGSGLGTFEDVVRMRPSPRVEMIFSHAHNDYLEIAATVGLPGVIFLLGLITGYILLWRHALRPPPQMTRERIFFLYAGLASLTTVALSALFDFNLFIPANAATTACIAGALASAVTIKQES